MGRNWGLRNIIKSIAKRMVLLIVGGIFVLSFSGCYFFPTEVQVDAPPLVQPEKPDFKYIVVKKVSKFEQKFTVPAWFVSELQSDISFKSRGGRLKAFYIKEGDTVKKGDLLAELDNDDLQSQIQTQQIYLQKAQLSYDRCKSSKGDKFSLEQAALDVKLAQMQLDSTKQEYDRARLLSPVSGVVEYVEPVSSGDYVDANKVIARITDPSRLQLRYDGSELSSFSIGMKVSARIKDKDYTAEVTMTPDRLPSNADASLKDSVQFKVDGLPSGIVAMGDYADITVVQQSKENVIALPSYLINDYNGLKSVKVLVGDVPQDRDVQVGMSSGSEVEIVSGLKEGEKVIER